MPLRLGTDTTQVKTAPEQDEAIDLLQQRNEVVWQSSDDGRTVFERRPDERDVAELHSVTVLPNE